MPTALALRTSLLLHAGDAPAASRALTTHADAVVFDLTAPGSMPRSVSKHIESLALSHCPVHVRLTAGGAGFESVLAAIVGASLTAVVLNGVERPQDVRDADVAIRRDEVRRGIEPGSVRLIPEVGSAATLRALPRILDAVDRHSAVALDVEGLAEDLRLPGPAASHAALLDHAMAEVALTAGASDIPWLLLAPTLDAGARAALATRAHTNGASGVYITSESEAQGFNALFTPLREAVADARRTLDAWHGRRTTDDASLSELRAMRRARTLVARANAIAHRERARG